MMFLWINDEPILIEAENKQEAYRKAITYKLQQGRDLMRAAGELAYEQITEIKEVECEPFDGDLPDEIEAVGCLKVPTMIESNEGLPPLKDI